MQTHRHPTCFSSGQKSKLFCCFPDCNLPAFFCSTDCSASHPHDQSLSWELIQQPIRLAMELPLTKDDVRILEKQDKQIQISIEELKALQQTHWKTLKMFRERLRLKGVAKKVLTAIKEKNANVVTGGDMAKLLKIMQTDEFFANKNKIQKAVDQRNQVVDQFAQKITAVIDEHRKIQKTLPKPEQIPNYDQLKHILPILSKFSPKVIVNDRLFTIKSGNYNYQPIFSCDPLNDGEYFEVEVISVGQKGFTIGIATSDLESSPGFNSADSLCISAYLGFLHFEGKEQSLNVDFKNGDKVMVLRSDNIVQWLCNGQSICEIDIPKQLLNKKLFPACWISSSKNSENISKLKFV